MARILTVKERLKWFRTFMSLYEKGSAVIQDVTNFDGDSLPMSLDVLFEGAMTLEPILEAVRNMPEPEGKELRVIKNEFKTALYNYIKAAELIAKYIKLGRHTGAAKVQLNAAINSIVLAAEYIESVSNRLSVPH